MSFEQDIAKFVAKTEAKMARVVQGVVISIGAQLVKYSPTGEWDLWSEHGKSRNPKPPYAPGSFIGSWKYSYNGMDSSHPATIDVSGGTSMARFKEVKGQPIAGMHYLYNNAPYAQVLETGVHPMIPNWALTEPNQRYGFGSGANMVELALIDSHGIVEEIANRENLR